MIKYQDCIYDDQQIEDKIVHDAEIFCHIQENVEKEYVYINKDEKEYKIKKHIRYILEDTEIKKHSLY